MPMISLPSFFVFSDDEPLNDKKERPFFFDGGHNFSLGQYSPCHAVVVGSISVCFRSDQNMKNPPQRCVAPPFPLQRPFPPVRAPRQSTTLKRSGSPPPPPMVPLFWPPLKPCPPFPYYPLSLHAYPPIVLPRIPSRPDFCRVMLGCTPCPPLMLLWPAIFLSVRMESGPTSHPRFAEQPVFFRDFPLSFIGVWSSTHSATVGR